MNTIFEHINGLCAEAFESLWLQEGERIIKIWDQFAVFAERSKTLKSDKPGRSTYANSYEFRHEDFSFEQIAPGKTYSNLSAGQYAAIQEISLMTRSIERMKLPAYLEREKTTWFEELAAKLNKYMAKLLTKEDHYIKGQLASSAKGYTIVVQFERNNEQKYMETICFPAGGTNVQCFHYRYKGKIK